MVDVTSGVGRIVWGHPLRGRPKIDQNTKQPVLKDGKQVMQYAFGVAFPKAEFGSTVWPAMSQAAMTLFPSGQFPPNFAWKYDDGDGIDSRGQPFANRTGYAGCIVLAISTEIPGGPRTVRLVNGAYVQVGETEIKCGDFVRVALGVEPHGPKPGAAGSPSGLYINPQLVEFVGQGDAIFSGADPNAVFGGQAVALPPGAVPVGSMPTPTAGPLPVAGPTPVQALPAPGQFPGMPAAAPAPAPAPGFPMQPAPAPVAAPSMPFAAPAAAPAMPSPAAAPMPGGFQPAPTASPTSFQPAPDFVAAAMQPQPAPAPVAAPAQIQQAYLPAGTPVPAGWRHVANAGDGRMIIQTP